MCPRQSSKSKYVLDNHLRDSKCVQFKSAKMVNVSVNQLSDNNVILFNNVYLRFLHKDLQH